MNCARRGKRFAETLAEAGVDVVLHLEAGAGHGHINEPGDAGAQRTIEAVAEWLARDIRDDD